jgi:transposase-like protein
MAPLPSKKYGPKLERVRCPACGADAVYNYGRSSSGKRRYLCLVCNRQFVENSLWQNIKNRPDCPVCGGVMHIYKREEHHVRFRCAKYPACRTFYKLSWEEVEKHELLHS